MPSTNKTAAAVKFEKYKGFTVLTDERGANHVRLDDAACMIGVTKDHKIIVIREEREVDGQTQTVWFLPAGRKSDKDADLKVTATREFQEEAGYISEHVDFFIASRPNAKFILQSKHAYIASDIVFDENWVKDENSALEVHALTRDEVLYLLNSGEIQGDVGDVLYRFTQLYDFETNSLKVAEPPSGSILAKMDRQPTRTYSNV